MPHIRQFLRSKSGAVATLLFLTLVLWRVLLIIFHNELSNNNQSVQLWAVSYQILAFWGVICGLAFSRYWGGWKSSVGKANILFALGLCGQLFGQTVSSYYVYKGASLPYPSLADIGFFVSIPLYAWAGILLARLGGARFLLMSFAKKLQVALIPLLMIAVSSLLFLRGYSFNWSQPLTIFLDLGYPLGDAIYVSIAILAFSLSWKILGGMMRAPIILFIVALVLQYVADFSFLYQNYYGEFIVGGLVDTLYMCAYFSMAVSLINLAVTFNKIKSS